MWGGAMLSLKLELMTSGSQFDWHSIIPTVVGGLISIITTVIMFSLARYIERENRAKERKLESAKLAYIGLTKLIKTIHAIENLAQNLDTQFREAHDLGKSDLQTALIIKPIIGAAFEIEDLSAGELSFLRRSDGELVAKIWKIQQRAKNNWAIMAQYSKLRTDFENFLESNANIASQIDGPGVSAEYKGTEENRIAIKIRRLDRLIDPLVAALKQDRISIIDITKGYIVAAHREFGDDFPAKKLEVRTHADP